MPNPRPQHTARQRAAVVVARRAAVYLLCRLVCCIVVSAALYWGCGEPMAADRSARMVEGDWDDTGRKLWTYTDPMRNIGSSWYLFKNADERKDPETVLCKMKAAPTMEPRVLLSHSHSLMYFRVGWPIEWAGGTAWVAISGRRAFASDSQALKDIGPNASAGSVLQVRSFSGSVMDQERWPRFVPRRVLWDRLAACVAIYAAALFVVVDGWRLTRASMRRRGGRCTMCGYSKRGLQGPTCPECGTSVQGARG